MKKTSILRATLLFSVMLLTLLPMAAEAQNDGNNNNASDVESTRRFWQASLPGGSYIVALDRISSISKHTYILNGNLKVTEVVIDTNGNSLARFYYIIPVTEDSSSGAAAGLTNRGKELLDKVGERTGVNANTAVAKQYPNTTHAKTVEYRISQEANLDQLFGSARTAWTKGRGRKFTIKNE
ncbi:MAG: hypothetical protein AB8F34_08575 [Akkermansiaceae bacterium]